MKVLRIIISILFLFLLISASNAKAKVGYIDLQRLVNESKMGQAARQEIQKLRKKKEKIVEEKLNQINILKQFINDQGDKMGADAKREKIKELQKNYKEYQRMVEDAKEDITREDRELVAFILDKADGVLKKVAKKEKFSIIIKDPDSIGYLDPDVDITDKVLKALDKYNK